MTDILILHGWGSRSQNWSEVRNLLEAQGIKVYIPDLPGFGQSPPLERPWSLDDYVEWLLKFINDSQARGELSEPFFLLGHSFGGAVAVKFTLKHPEKLKKLFLVAPAIIRRKSSQKERFKKTASFFSFLPSFIKKIIYKLFIPSDYPVTKGVIRETYLKIIKEDLSSSLSEIKVPTIIIWGKEDKVTPFKEAHFIKEKISGAFLEILPKIGHSPHREVPGELTRTILRHLQ